MKDSYQNSVIAQLLEAIINETTYEGETNSDIADILLSILEHTEYTKAPRSVIADLLLRLKAKLEGKPFEPYNGAYFGEIAAILISILDESEYTKAPRSRIAELLLELKSKISAVYDATIENGIAYFDGVTVSQPLVSLKLNIPVTQTGSGTPSPDNIRDFVGVSQAVISRTGKNLFDLSRFATTYPSNCSWSDGVLTIKKTGKDLYTTGIKVNIPSDILRCYLSFEIKNETAQSPRVRIQYSDGTTSEYGPTEYDGWTKVEGLLDDKRITAITLNWMGDWLNAGSFRLRNFCINFSSINSNDYEPYTGNTYPITFGQTVYSANLDVLTGKLSITHELKTIDENSLIAMSSTNIGIFAINNFFDEVNDNDSINCDHYQRGLNRSGADGVLTYNPEGSFCCNSTSKILYIKDTRFTTIEDYKTWLSTNPVKIAVKLAEPIEIQLTPTQITTLIGENVIFADVGDVTECKYKKL